MNDILFPQYVEGSHCEYYKIISLQMQVHFDSFKLAHFIPSDAFQIMKNNFCFTNQG